MAAPRVEALRVSRLAVAIPLLSLASMILTSQPLDAISITIQGNWSKTVQATDLTGEAGSDLVSTYESDPNQSVVSIQSTTGSWRVDVKKSDSVWDSGLGLDVRRTSDGTGVGSITGGTSYLEITGVDTTFFDGLDDRLDIDLQLRITGVSTSLGAQSFATTITYTVIEN